MAKLSSGDRAPDFTLGTETGETVKLEPALKNGPVVLIFYPMDNTPGCTAQLCAVRDDNARYAAAGVAVYGVNGGDAASHQKFIAKYNLTAPLLIDKGLKVAGDYDAVIGVGPLKLINRTVVAIARDGTIALYKRGSPSTDEILRAVGATPA
ncbi:MAG: peroxiredoxin [Candidatus Eremiobacteraeota bacterium]|nr:peroxiredoxin [Candidatus Eremiobacteraeota bacterium]